MFKSITVDNGQVVQIPNILNSGILIVKSGDYRFICVGYSEQGRVITPIINISDGEFTLEGGSGNTSYLSYTDGKLSLTNNYPNTKSYKYLII